MEGGNGIWILLIALCLVMSAYFSATETAFSSLNKIRIKNLAERGNRRARLVLELEDRYDNLLSSLLIGNNIVNILSTSLATVMFVQMLGEEQGASVSTVVMTVVVLIFGEVSPKSIAKEAPEDFAMFSAPIIHMIMRILSPLNFLFSQWKKLLTKVFKAEKKQGITEEEFLTFVEEAKQDGGLDEQEEHLIKNAVEFTEQEAMDIATPRIQVEGIEEGASQEEVERMFAETMFSRLPVYKETIDHITGIIYQKDFYHQVYHKGGSLKDIVRPALFVSENKKIGELLRQLQKNKMHIAVVVDEFGQTAGIVTLEDILEELVGEIWDEHDEVVQEIQKVSDTEYLADGSANVEKVMARLGLNTDVLEDIDAVSVSGWVMELTGDIPSEGDQIQWNHLKITVLKMEGRRVDRVKIQMPAPESTPCPESGKLTFNS